MSEQKGFSLVEVILYVMILSILLVGVIQINIIIKQSQVRFNSERTTNSEASIVLNNIDFLVRNADNFATDDTGPCLDFVGAGGASTYYASLYYNTSSSATILPDICVGKGTDTASTTAIKIYWKSSSDKSVWMDCYQGFINSASGNCTTIQGDGDVSIRMTSGRNTFVYDNGLQFATSTSGSNVVLETFLTLGTPRSSAWAYQATTTASSSVAFRLDVGDDIEPTEAICGNGVQEGSEVCDSDLTSECSITSGYYSGNFDDDGDTCSGYAACNATCSACIVQASCAAVCGNGSLEGSELCDSGQSSQCADSAGYYYDSFVGTGGCSGSYACNASCSACVNQATCTGPVCGDGVKSGSEVCDRSNSTKCSASGYKTYYMNSVGCPNGDDACSPTCAACITFNQCVGIG